LLRRPEVSFRDLLTLRAVDGAAFAGSDAVLDPAVAEQVEIQVKYAGYISRQQHEVARHESHETTRIPSDFDYSAVRGLSIEVRQKLAARRPETIGQAARMAGVTPAAISLLLVHIRRHNSGGDGGRRAA
jgi:tRNA uridine 5-carboxymethylaminomethyl modification enzyme